MLENQKEKTLQMKAIFMFSRVEGYIRANPGVAFIIFFQILLLTCLFLIVGGNMTLAVEFAIYAYPTLVIGVVLQLFSHLVYGKERSQVDHELQVEETAVPWKGEESEEPVLSVVMPAYNEERLIGESIKRLENDLRRLNLEHEIVVVDDGSTDNTHDVVKKMVDRSEGKLRLIRLDRNGGKGKAFRRGYEASRGSYVLLIDADLETPLNLLDDYLEKIRVADIVVASKRHPESEVDYGLFRSFLSRGFNIMVNVLFSLGLNDTQCGLKLFKREVLDEVMPRLLVKKYAFDVELLVNARKMGFKVVTAPVIIRNLRERPMKMKEIFKMALDLLAIFYRLHFTKTYN